jgi:two-component sensor histidine kinase
VIVSFKRLNDSKLQLEVRDDGVGIPAGRDFKAIGSMGMNIIRTLTEQISGTITHDGSAGTRFTVEFPDSESPDAE